MMPSHPPERRTRPRRREMPGRMQRGLAAVFVLAVLLAGYELNTSLRDVAAGWHATTATVQAPQNGVPGTASAGPSPAPSIAMSTPIPLIATSTPPSRGPLPSIQDLASSFLSEKWSGTERVTVLVLGEDHRQGDTERAFQTDTMMLVSVDPVAKTITLLSIPRDLWVDIPGSGNYKIDEANFLGDAYGYPGGGPALAVKTVQSNFKLKVDYSFRIDFTAFETFIDAIGGIDIVNAKIIDDPQYPDGSYGYEPFYLSAGPHHLDGHDALRYARTRHGSTDIVRAQHQQEVILAVRDKVLSLNLLPSLIAQAPALYQKLNASVTTNLTLQQMIALAVLAQDIPEENIKSAVIDYNYVQNGLEPAPAGNPLQQVLIPEWDRIDALLSNLFPAAKQRTARSAAIPAQP
jgi:polyisoprenyl-teichoic acid--peptidoglycan teichoic acid transferase